MFVITRDNKDLYTSGCRVEVFNTVDEALAYLNPEDGLFKLEKTGKRLDEADDAIEEILFTDDTSVRRLELNVTDAIDYLLDLNMYDNTLITRDEIEAYKDGDMSKEEEAELLVKLAPDAEVVSRSEIKDIKESIMVTYTKLHKMLQD